LTLPGCTKEAGDHWPYSAEEYPTCIEETPPQAERADRALQPLREAFAAALLSLDLRRSRELVLDAPDTTLGRLYVDVVRPAIEQAGLRRPAPDSTGSRLMFGSLQAVLGTVAARPVEGAAMRGRGREALVSVGSGPLDRLDGQVIVDVLCADGWQVTEVEAGAEAAEVAALALARHVQLVVMPTANPADLLLSAATYTLLRRLADPPVIVACSFGHPDETRRARAAGADAFVNDPDDLLRLVDRRLPAGAGRNWGVRLRRLGETLVVAPTGDLDEGSVRRLRQVVDSRSGDYAGVIVDGRDVASATLDGVEALLGWLRGASGHRVLPGPAVIAALHGTVLETALVAAPADAG
jgi:CheY-like chemotaxis protein